MTLFQMECCQMVAKHKNFSQAARELYISQPVLSRNISILEDEVGFKIFKRNTRMVSLTPAGEELAKGCEKIISLYKETLEMAHLAEKGLDGTVTIGIFSDGYQKLLIDISNSLKSECPQISVVLKEYNHTELKRAFFSGKVDVIEELIDEPIEDGYDYLVVGQSYPCAIVPVGSTFASRNSISIKELKNEKFISFNPSISNHGYQYLQKISGNAGFIPYVTELVSGAIPLLMKVANGDGISVMGSDFSKIAGEDVVFLPLRDVRPSTAILVWKSDNTNPCLPRFIEHSKRILSK